MKLKSHKTLEEKTFTDFSIACTRLSNKDAPDIITLKFKDKNTASQFIIKLKDRLPLLNTPFPQLTDLNVSLTKEQDLFLKRLIMCESGNLTMDYLKDCLLKTLRADEFDFSYQFLLGIIPGDNNSRRLHNLRPSQRKSYLINPDGYVSNREYKTPMYSEKEKIGFSQAQSNTLLDPNALSRAFGFNKDQRNDKLYGIVTHLDDALFNRLLVDDSGTVNRIFDFDTHDQAYTGLDQLREGLFTRKKISEFKIANKKARKSNPRTNEVLARIRFNPYRTVVCICSDTLEARLLAYHFAQELLEEYKIYAEKNGFTVNPNFRIPIIYYLRKEKVSGLCCRVYHETRQYTNQMRIADEAQASLIHSIKLEKVNCYHANNFEFLLGLKTITKDILLDMCLGQPLAYIMMKNGYTRMLMRLLKTPQIKEQVFNSLTYDHIGLIRQNDPIIANLVLCEEFELANKLIEATNTDKFFIKMERSEHEYLSTHLLNQGNPRQIEFMGLDEMLLQAADLEKWVVVKLCLKEFKSIKNETILQLFSLALKNSKKCEYAFIFKKASDMEETLTLLFDIGIESNEDWWFIAMRFYLDKGNIRAASMIFTHPKMNSKNFDDCVEVLINYIEHIPALAPYLSNKIKSNQIRAFCNKNVFHNGILSKKDEIVALLKQTIDDPIHNEAQFMDFYFVFDSVSYDENLEIEKELMRLLKPSTIKHMFLIYIVDRFRCHIKPFQEAVCDIEKSNWPNLTSAFKNMQGLIDYRLYKIIKVLSPSHAEILTTLDHYLIDIKTIPPEETIHHTYSVVLSLFERVTQSESTFPLSPMSKHFDAHTAHIPYFGFFEMATQLATPSKSEHSDFNTKYSNYMRYLDLELSKSQKSTNSKETTLPVTHEQSENGNLTQQPVYSNIILGN